MDILNINNNIVKNDDIYKSYLIQNYNSSQNENKLLKFEKYKSMYDTDKKDLYIKNEFLYTTLTNINEINLLKNAHLINNFLKKAGYLDDFYLKMVKYFIKF